MHLKRNSTPFASVPAPVDAQGRHAPVSYWHTTVDITPGAPLAGESTCDVAIIGGGYTGLSTAYYLKQARPDLNVALLEYGVVGHGASGRNGGFAMPLIGWDLHYTAHKLGDAAAKQLYTLMYDAVEHLKTQVKTHNIDCDLEETGYILISTCARRERRMREEHATANRLGFESHWLDQAQLQHYIRSDSFRSGLLDPKPCIINPAKLARGMKRVVEEIGVRVYEQTPVEELQDINEGVSIRTPHGSMKARAAVLAVNGYGGALGFMKSRVLPVHSYIVMTEPLTHVQLETIGWAKHRASLETARNLIHYFRLTADNRIAFGGEDADLYNGGAYRNHDASICEALKRRFREYFPSLAGVQFAHEWGGVLGVTLDMFPSFGREGNLFFATGYSGHGVSLSNYAGKLLAPPVLKHLKIDTAGFTGAQSDFLFTHRPMPLPPDPFRYLGMQAYRWGLRTQDKLEGA